MNQESNVRKVTYLNLLYILFVLVLNIQKIIFILHVRTLTCHGLGTWPRLPRPGWPLGGRGAQQSNVKILTQHLKIMVKPYICIIG